MAVIINCSFYTIPLARGRSHAVEVDRIVELSKEKLEGRSKGNCFDRS
ncbi:MAG: hypothetical protein IPN15_17880 [Saprospiraceae bacterium]|nr:hypothetical protein [Candidatus Vicinibacter affinis]